jgi:murein DD-endopeptidase MepM/ murein hydrolase activator NlpD
MTRSLMVGMLWIIFLWLGCGQFERETDCSEDDYESTVEYGLVTDSFLVIKDKVKKNQNLASILLPYGVPYATIDQLAKASKQVFDVRKLAAGMPYTILCTKDSTGFATCFIYEANATDYVVFDMRDSLHIYMGQKPIEKRVRHVKGKVNSSLYVDIKNTGADPVLAIELSEIYAWTIDFYRIQKGDAFEVLFTESFVEGRSVGIDHISSSTFTHNGKTIKAYNFESPTETGYYDEKGNNLKKAFLKAPVKFSRISSGYSMKRFHPVQKRFKAHLGTDYAAPTGTPIMAVGDGVITEARYTPNNGNFVKMKHNNVYSTQYLHMSKIKAGVRPGTRVRQGDIIGYVGSTGLATGPHVCFRFWKNGKQVNHRELDLPPSEPISKAARSQFDRYVAHCDSMVLSLQKSL